jgi:outer membrane protein
VAAHAGLDFRLGQRGALRVDVRWIDIDSTVRLDGARLGTVNLDPWVYGAAYVLKF